jgi:hypothetical protein
MMDWEIIPFEGLGPIKFGMPKSEVHKILGEPKRVRNNGGGSFREIYAADLPIVTFENDKVSEIEAFYDMSEARLGDITIFSGDGIGNLARLEVLNGGAREHVGTILFENLGLATGRLDEDVVEAHNLSLFMKGAWDDRLPDFKKISFS